ncbi:nitrile hydratase, putative [Psychroflexus torquis ATCC 700755]|uniref:Nitrile hydratase, putative n=1 Tax=Psychroflexus torquis (strain ATCC 700755 / CIP 106069 / ACAM 623) TaxID=313595 RepID=K4IY05_PSYTT|nr:nitrile hydratase [Psychroflexus torquis]AFU70365.1 nitrile hydratase, putative [Psychroflexus torquis ATCC 700755]
MSNTITDLGIMNKSEISKFKISLIKSNLNENLKKILGQVGLNSYAKFNFKDVKIPDSKLALLAIEEANDIYTPILLKHCYRTFFWSAGIAISEGIKTDNELIFISSILHDSGLTDKHNSVCSSQCFANYGGDYAKDFVLNKGINMNKANLIKRAIDMHLYPDVDKKKFGNESYLLSKGAAIDVIGSHSFQLPNAFINKTQNEYSRINFKQDIIQSMETLNHKENTRADILFKMGFKKLANKNTLDTDF